MTYRGRLDFKHSANIPFGKLRLRFQLLSNVDSYFSMTCKAKKKKKLQQMSWSCFFKNKSILIMAVKSADGFNYSDTCMIIAVEHALG